MMICQNAKKCKEICDHIKPHRCNNSCNDPCCSNDGFRDAKCVQYKEETMVLFPSEMDKENPTTKEEQVLQKLEELNDQTAKKDAGKLRYDLIPGELLTSVTWEGFFETDTPNMITEATLNAIISNCISILGGYTNFLRELAKVYTFGCQKYSERSWQTVPNGRARYEAGMFRHIDAFKRGEYVNWEDGGCLHIAQVAFNALAVKWFILQEK